MAVGRNPSSTLELEKRDDRELVLAHPIIV